MAEQANGGHAAMEEEGAQGGAVVEDVGVQVVAEGRVQAGITLDQALAIFELD